MYSILISFPTNMVILVTTWYHINAILFFLSKTGIAHEKGNLVMVNRWLIDGWPWLIVVECEKTYYLLIFSPYRYLLNKVVEDHTALRSKLFPCKQIEWEESSIILFCNLIFIWRQIWANKAVIVTSFSRYLTDIIWYTGGRIVWFQRIFIHVGMK